jgi:hypothetical protein
VDTLGDRGWQNIPRVEFERRQSRIIIMEVGSSGKYEYGLKKVFSIEHSREAVITLSFGNLSQVDYIFFRTVM